MFAKSTNRFTGLLATALLAASALAFDAAQAREPEPFMSHRESLLPAASAEGNFLAAYIASSARDTTAAAVYFRRLFDIDPSNPDITERAFIAFLADGDMEGAFLAAERIVNADPNNGLAHLALGVRDLQQARYAAARARLEQGGIGQAADLTATLLRAWAFAGSKDPRQAMTTVDRLEGEATFDIFRHYHGGLIANFVGRPNDAERRLAAAYEQQPTALSIVDAYARLLARRGKTQEALAVYEAFSEIVPRHPTVVAQVEKIRAGETVARAVSSVDEGAAEVLYALGSAGNSQGDELPAIIYLRLALHLAPTHQMTLITLADIYERMQQYEQAIEVYEAIPADSAVRDSADIQIGVALERLDRKDEASAHLEELMERRPDDVEVVVAFANILRVRQQFEEAAEAYSKAIDLIDEPDRSHWTLFYFRGASYERSKQWEKAEADLKTALELVPENTPIGEAQILNYLGYSWVDMGINIDEAFKLLQRAVELSPRDGMIIDSLGWAYFRLGRYDDAVRELERAVELMSSDPVINDHLGDAYWKVGRRLEATFQWRHALASDPEPDDRENIERKLIEGLDGEKPPAAVQRLPFEQTREGG
ncbi:MAG TPA: tetratricopeptide repeat protein [Saliniramus sp.]|nr:tetratricopeptide repeat protein [Saliniramus sp.]